MIARLYVALPFIVTIPEGEQFDIYSCIVNEHKIKIYPPRLSDIPFYDDVEEISLNGNKAFRANMLLIDFIKDIFDRRGNIICDPPIEFIKNIINMFLIKLRFVTRGSAIKPIDFPNVNWHIAYLNNDESELLPEKGLVRGRGVRSLKFSWIAVNNEVWGNLHSLPYDYKPPIWELLLLDAVELLSEVGPAIVLAMTALEVFISISLNLLAEKNNIPKELWTWINNRDYWLKNPSTEEQFDKLLKIMIGISLNDEKELRTELIKLKKARNSFVHEGVAKIGDQVLKWTDAQHLIGSANKIIRFIKEKLPEDMKWPEFKYNFEVQAKMKLFKNKSSQNSEV
jgi:hypothetical protein